MMPPLVYVCDGLASPVDESMLAPDNGTDIVHNAYSLPTACGGIKSEINGTYGRVARFYHTNIPLVPTRTLPWSIFLVKTCDTLPYIAFTSHIYARIYIYVFTGNGYSYSHELVE